jgi:hypothetical protein
MVSFFLAFLAACADGSGDSSSGKGGDAEDPSGEGASPEVAPEVLSLDRAECVAMQSAGEVWDLALTVDDPQGAATVRAGTFDVRSASGGDVLTDQLLACGNGSCFGSFRADTTGISCATQVRFRFVVTDVDGNASAPYDPPQ